MSRIPRAGGNKPPIKSTSTVTSKTASGGTRTTTTTKIRKLEPYSAAEQGRLQSSGCQPCPSGASGQSSIRPPQARRIVPPAARQAAPTRRPAPPAQMRPPVAGEYNVPAQFGPISRGGKGMTFSSPSALRSQMETRVPKEIKYAAVKGCPYQEGKSRAALQGTKLGDTLAGSFNVYGGPTAQEELGDRSGMDQRKVHSSVAVLHDFHKSVCVLFDKPDAAFKRRSVKFLAACTGLFSIYVSRCIAHTMESIVSFTESVNVAPYLKLYVDFEVNLVLTPTKEEVIKTFHKLLDDIISAGQDLNVMEKGRIKGYGSKKICLCLTEKFIGKCKRNIENNVSRLYEPILSYLDKLGSDFAEIYSDINSDNVFHNNNADILFDEGCRKIQYYKKFIHNVVYIPDKEYFKIGQLDLTNYREKLYDSLRTISDSFFKNLSSQHLWEVNDICDSFQLIKVRATQKPLTTEELIEIGKFMAWVRNEQLDALNQRVHVSLNSLCNIITLGLLDEDHMKINSTAMNWIENILPIIEEHSTIYEQLKFEAEEKLQKVIEDINVMITDMYPLLVILDEMDDIKLARKYLSKITLHMAKIKEIQLRIEWINNEEVCLSFPKSGYAEFENLKDYVYPFYHLLKLSLDVQKHVSVWQYGQFDLLDYASADEMVDKLCKELEEIQKNYRKKLRQAQDENLPVRFKGTVDDPDILNWPAPLKLCGMSLNILEEFKPSLTIMRIMCNVALRPRHWKAMSEIAGFNLMPNAGTTLKKMMEYDLQDKLHEYEIISTCATKEQQLLDNLNSLKAQWQNVDFDTSQNEQNICVVVRLEHIQTTVDQHVIKILNMRSSVFVKPFDREVLGFYDTISNISSMIGNWIVLQDVYLKLLPIFALADVVKHIPGKEKCFRKCDFVFKKYTGIIRENRRVVDVISQTDIVEDLKKSLVILEEVQKGVNDYLEIIRLRCSRLYFISDEELIDLIALNLDFSDQRFLVKIFPGIKYLKCCQEKEVEALFSQCGEEINLKNPIRLTSDKNLDQILIDVEQAMLNTIKYKTANCYRIFKKTPIIDLLKKFPQQSLQVMAKVFWTDQVENALKLSHNIKLLIYKRKLEEHIEEKINILHKNAISNTERITLKNLILNDLNNKYLLSSFVKEGMVISDEHFNWQVQLKYYFQKSLCSLQVLKSTLDYSYEYLGNSDQIILTPLTDRCFITLLNAYFFHYFGLVEGRSQTGKSISIESLAGALGKFFISVVCISKFSAKPLLRLIKGAAMCGAWLNLKNIDYLKSEVLSVISQELLSIVELKKVKSNEICFGGAKLPFSNTCFILVQMSKFGKAELPENFRAMFRTFALCQPDLGVIVDGLFASMGIQNFKLYSNKLQEFLALLEGILSRPKQLRQVKRVLALFEENITYNACENYYIDVLRQSLQDVFLPGLLDGERAIFDSILSDVFSAAILDKDKKHIEKALVGLNLQLNLSMNDDFISKAIGTYEGLKTGRNIILLGDTNTAKTTILKICQQLFKKLDNLDISLHIMNPKCIAYSDLIGATSCNDNIRWTDGILLNVLRNSNEGHKWVLFDGHIDQGWAKDVAHVLDNGRLFLETLEILMVEDGIHLLFESTSLDNCAPSMVSRCSTIYFPHSILDGTSLIETWLKTCQSDWLTDHRNSIEVLFKWFVPPCLEAIGALNLDKYCQLDDNTMVKNTLIYFQLILDDATSKINKKDEDPKNIAAWIHATFIQAGILGFSGFMPEASRQKFDELYKLLWKGQNQAHPYPKCLERLEVSVPADGILFDYSYLYKQRGTWKLWVDLLKNEKITESQYLNACVIPTVDTMRCNFLLDLHVKYKRNFLIVGPKSTGKSLAMKDCYINRLPENDFEKAIITFNDHLTAQGFQKLLLSKLNRKSPGCYSASHDKRFVCFLDDLHFSSKDVYNVSGATELLRQHLDHNVWYDFRSLKDISLENINFCASTNNNNNLPVPNRLLRHFNIFGINEFSQDNVGKIYSQILSQAWKKSGFPSDMLNTASQLVNACLNIFVQMQQTIRATLSKCHYIFDLNGLSKVVQGCAFLKKETYDANKKIHVKLWVHEVFRVFGDRFYLEDIGRLTAIVKGVVVEYFPEEFGDVFANFEDELPFAQLFFGTFQDKDLEPSVRHYDEVNFLSLGEMCVQYLRNYNETSLFKLDLSFFNYALEKLARICRILSMANENALLLGVTGCGRQSLTKFASFLYKFEFYQSVITRTFDSISWTSDFKYILKRCGGMDEKCVFLVAEEQLIKEDFFEIIDHYIRDGEITDLFSLDEKQEILELSRLAAQGGNRNLDISSHKVFLYFNTKCRENFHLLLSLNSTSTDNLRKRICKYPCLASRMNVILWKDWPDSALYNIAQNSINTINLPEDIKEKTISAALYFHRTCSLDDNMTVSPKAYIHLNKLFVDLITQKQKTLTLKKNRYQQGLAKLSYAASQIFKMQKALAEYQPLLEEMTKNAIEMTEQIALETIEVEKASALVRQDEKIASEQAVIAQVLKSECESELAQAIPILEDAISALNTLKPSDITLVKSMKNPPDAIKLVMASVCVIKDVKPDRIPDPSTGRKTIDYWGPSKRILGDMNFLQTLKDFDKDHIKPEIMAKIRKEYLPHKDFKPHVVAKASSAAEGLCKWIIAMDMYDRVAKEVAPKKEKLNKAEKDYAQTMLILNEKKEEVVRIEEKLAQLNDLLADATKKQVKLQDEVDLCNKKLRSAQKLITGLSGERFRWTDAVENLQRHYDVLAGDILLSSAIIAYLPALNNHSRSIMATKWQSYIEQNHIPATKDFNLSSVLSSDVEIERWTEQGLPADPFFIENAIIFNNSKYFRLLLDPHGQALQWIQNFEGISNVILTKFTFRNWLNDLKYCMEHGKAILINDTKGVIPPCLNSLIYGQTFAKNKELFVTIDGENWKLHSSARIYIVCTNPNSTYSLEIKSRVTAINFSLTSNALRQDVLRIVVEIEKPEIQKLSKEFVQRNRESKSELKNLEAKILNTLCESEADILEDQESIIVLDKSKELTKIALEKQHETEKIAEIINNFKSKYVSVAKHVACLFFCINDLQKLHRVYHFSLKWFKNVYFISILNAGKSKDLQIRCRNLCDTFTYDLYRSVSKALFEVDKLLFTFWLACRVAVNEGCVSEEEILKFFSIDVDANANDKSSSDNILVQLLGLEELDIFKGVAESWVGNPLVWHNYLESKGAINISNVWNITRPFARLLLVKVLKPDELYFEIITFIEQILGGKFLMPTFFSIQEVYNESYSLVPVLFILTSGLNVLNILHIFANVKQVLHKFNHLSLDKSNAKQQGEQLIKQGQIAGCWVLLQNCQYTDDWLYELEENLLNMDFENTDENFRLFLTTDDAHDIPLEILQNSIKIIDEAPSNLRKNLLKIYNKAPIIVDDYFYGCPGRQEYFSKLLFKLCYFHYLLRERHNILNWNILYQFEESDLLLSMEFLRKFLNEQSCLFEKVYYLIGECNYNSHLENQWEKTFVIELLRDCINDKMFDKNSATYSLPIKNDRRDYLQHITNMPLQDPPGVLYLTEHELLKQKLLKTKQFFDVGLKFIRPKEEFEIAKEEDKILNIIDDILLLLLPQKMHYDSGEMSNNIILREINLYNNLLKIIRNSLNNLKTALQGDIICLSETLEDIALNIMQNKIPKMWLKYFYPTVQGLSNFAKNICENVLFLKKFAHNQKNILLRAFFFPKSIITHRKLIFAKRLGVSVSELNFEHNLNDEDFESAIIFEGLFMFGARFYDGQIVELAPNKYYSALPALAMTPVIAVPSPDDYKCCIFRTEAFPQYFDYLFLSGTENFIMDVYLKCDGKRQFWIKRGVSFVCEINR